MEGIPLSGNEADSLTHKTTVRLTGMKRDFLFKTFLMVQVCEWDKEREREKEKKRNSYQIRPKQSG